MTTPSGSVQSQGSPARPRPYGHVNLITLHSRSVKRSASPSKNPAGGWFFVVKRGEFSTVSVVQPNSNTASALHKKTNFIRDFYVSVRVRSSNSNLPFEASLTYRQIEHYVLAFTSRATFRHSASKRRRKRLCHNDTIFNFVKEILGLIFLASHLNSSKVIIAFCGSPCHLIGERDKREIWQSIFARSPKL